MTATEVLADLRTSNPGRRFAATANGNAVGVWVDDQARFVVCFGATIVGGAWCRMPELLANGKPIFGPDDWKE